MPNQKEFGQTGQDWRSASPVYSRKTDLIEQDFGKLAAKLPRMQLIVDLLPAVMVRACSYTSVVCR